MIQLVEIVKLLLRGAVGVVHHDPVHGLRAKGHGKRPELEVVRQRVAVEVKVLGKVDLEVHVVGLICVHDGLQ